MAYQELYRFAISNRARLYYQASEDNLGNWNVTTSTPIQYLKVLPDGWPDTEIVWERDMSYLGTFRTGTTNNFKFSQDGRAIIQYIRNNEGIQGYGILHIYKLNGFSYELYYETNLDFKTCTDYLQSEILEISLLEESAVRDLHAFGDTAYNIPIWKNTGSVGAPNWVLNDSEWIWHDGIKLLYNATYTSSAAPFIPSAGGSPEIDNRLIFSVSPITPPATTTGATYGNALVGFNKGQYGDPGSGPDYGYHTVLFLNQYSVTQNNGATTFIGNDILSKQLIQNDQGVIGVPESLSIGGFNLQIGERRFWEKNDSRPFTRNNYCLKNLLQNDSPNCEMFVQVEMNIEGNIDQLACGHSRLNPFIGFALFKIDGLDHPTITPGTGGHSYMTPEWLFKLPLLGTGTSSAISTPSPTPLPTDTLTHIAPLTLEYGFSYVFALIYDDDIGMRVGDAISQLVFTKLQFSFLSKYWRQGDPGRPSDVNAPFFPASPAAGFRLLPLLNKVVSVLPSKQSDAYGFPIAPTMAAYTLESNFLDNPATNPSAPSAPVGDLIPWQILLTSFYCLHDLSGQSYVTITFNQAFDFCKKILGMGLQLIGNVFKMENLRTFFDANTMILDLGFDVSEPKITQDTQNIGANLKLGYSKADTNTDFGIDPINTGQYYNTPISNLTSVMDFEEDSILTEMYATEKARAQQTSQPIGANIDPQNPSSDNRAVIIYCEPVSSITVNVAEPTDATGTGLPTNTVAFPGFRPVKFANAQSVDPSASSAPYLQGFYYPDTAINVPLSPCRIFDRDTGALIHSYMDKQDADSLIFRNTYVMQYNNTSLALPGFSTNLKTGAGAAVINEFSDKPISGLPPKLFLANICTVTTTSPINLFTILNTNPNGYVRFFVRKKAFGNVEYRFFINKAVQKATPQGNIATEMEGWLCPSNGTYVSLI